MGINLRKLDIDINQSNEINNIDACLINDIDSTGNLNEECHCLKDTEIEWYNNTINNAIKLKKLKIKDLFKLSTMYCCNKIGVRYLLDQIEDYELITTLQLSTACEEK